MAIIQFMASPFTLLMLPSTVQRVLASRVYIHSFVDWHRLKPLVPPQFVSCSLFFTYSPFIELDGWTKLYFHGSVDFWVEFFFCSAIPDREHGYFLMLIRICEYSMHTNLICSFGQWTVRGPWQIPLPPCCLLSSSLSMNQYSLITEFLKGQCILELRRQKTSVHPDFIKTFSELVSPDSLESNIASPAYVSSANPS